MKTNLEQEILQVAEKLFLSKGYNGTSTTEIAHQVGCNQALIHYYFRTKERLFQQTFIKKFESTISRLIEPLTTELPFNEKITNCINIYFDIFTQNPRLPFTILNELILNPERRTFIKLNFVKNSIRQNAYSQYCQTVKNEIQQGNIRQIEPFDLIINIVSLTAFTFISLPIYADLLDRTPKEVETYITHRRQEIITQIITSLRPTTK